MLCQCVGEECTAPTPEPTEEPTVPVSFEDWSLQNCPQLIVMTVLKAPTCDAGWIANEGLGCIKPLAEDADTTTQSVIIIIMLIKMKCFHIKLRLSALHAMSNG